MTADQVKPATESGWATRLWRALFPWRRDKRNPARRYCRTCGQQQDLWGVNGERGFIPTGWESTYPARPCSARTHDEDDS